jgi:class 3 adenylate cyclase
MSKTVEQLEAENRELRAELERIKSKQALTMFGNVTVAPRTAKLTIVGLEEMIVAVGDDDTVGYVNTSMMKLLGIGDRQQALGTPLTLWDDGPLGENTLKAIVQAARSSEEVLAFERPFPDIPRQLLPTTDVPVGASETILRFTASSQKDRVQIVAQDVTRTRWLETTFARYLSPKVIEQMQGIGADELLSMERRELTILFCDLRGFTTLCQEAEPEQVRDTINTYLAGMVDCVERLDGTVQGFVGDEVMAIFGAPLPQEDHALRALICAVEMQRVHGAWIEDRMRSGRPAPPTGIGLATGEVVVGNIGTESRMDYTAQGHGVNLAARLCGAALAGEVLTVPETHLAAMKHLKTYDGEVAIPRLSFGSKGKLTFKNVKQPVEVLSVRVKA